MPKSKKKKDFQKVKLKVGKRLKKADNVTNTSFQSRTVQVTQRLKSETSEPSTKRKLSIQELLTQCQHYNISVRHDAVTGLRELLTSHHDVLTSHLGSILERSASLFTDKDPVVRQAVIKLLKSILPVVSAKHFSTFFPVVSAHLCCAMTHIYDDVQVDSLEVMDLILDNYPELVISNSTQLLPNFIEQISCKKSSAHQTKGHERALAVNPNSKTSTQKWRVGVLKRLQKLLSAIIKFTFGGKTKISIGKASQSDTMEQEMPDKNGKVLTWTFENTSKFPFPQTFKNKFLSKGYTLSCHGDKNKPSQTASDKWISVTEEAGMEKFVKLLIPLLLECWVEASTASNFSGRNVSGELLSYESLELRLSVLQVIQLLWKCVNDHTSSQIKLWRNMYLSDFQNYFLQHFPYSVHQSLGKKKKKIPVVEGKLSAKTLNLTTCGIMTFFLGQARDDQSEAWGWTRKITEYLSSVLCDDDLDLQDISLVLEIINRLLAVRHGSLEDLLPELLRRYTKTHPLSGEKKLLFSFFSDVILNFSSHISENVSEKFIETLPQLLIVVRSNHKTAAQILSVIKTSVCQSNLSVRVKDKVLTFLEQTTDITNPLFVDLDIPCQRLIVELLYFLPPKQESSLSHVARLCNSLRVPSEISLYLLQVLNHRFLKDYRSTTEVSKHISFLLTVLVERNETNYDDQNTWKFDQFEVCCHFETELWERSLKINKAVAECFLQFVNTSQVIEVLCEYLSSYLSSKSVLTGEQVISLIELANRMEFWKYPISSSLINIFVKTVWCLMHVIALKLSEMQADFMHKIIDICSRYISCTSNAMENLVQILVQETKGVDVEAVETHCRMFCVLLRRENFRCAVDSHSSSLLISFVTNIQTSFPDVRKHQWWTDMEYLVSLATNI